MSTKFFRSLCSRFYVALVPECYLVQFVHEAKSMQKIAPADDCLLITILTTFLNDKIFFLNYFMLFTIRFISVFKTKRNIISVFLLLVDGKYYYYSFHQHLCSYLPPSFSSIARKRIYCCYVDSFLTSWWVGTNFEPYNYASSKQ